MDMNDEFPVPVYVGSLLRGLLSVMDRLYWNTRQEEWDRCDPVEMGGVRYVPYGHGEDMDHEGQQANFWLDEENAVHLNWYKHPARCVSSDRELTASEWCAWHDRVYRALSLYEFELSRTGMLHPDDVYHWHV